MFPSHQQLPHASRSLQWRFPPYDFHLHERRMYAGGFIPYLHLQCSWFCSTRRSIRIPFACPGQNNEQEKKKMLLTVCNNCNEWSSMTISQNDDNDKDCVRADAPELPVKQFHKLILLDLEGCLQTLALFLQGSGGHSLVPESFDKSKALNSHLFARIHQLVGSTQKNQRGSAPGIHCSIV